MIMDVEICCSGNLFDLSLNLVYIYIYIYIYSASLYLALILRYLCLIIFFLVFKN